MKTITLTINNQPITVESGVSVLEAARQAGVHIPTLCYHRDLHPEGHCRVCLVEIEGQRTLQPACTFPVADGMIVKANSARARQGRKFSVELLLSNHPNECLTCTRNQNCELQQLAQEMGITERRFEGDQTGHPIDDSAFVIRDSEKCVNCRRCVRVCQQVQSVSVLGVSERGWESKIGPAFGRELVAMDCVNCGQCINYCPVGALTERRALPAVWKELADPEKVVVVQTAPAVRVALGEALGLDPGMLVTGKMVSALRQIGFDKVFDTDFTADLTILEEGNELIQRLTTGGKLPLITSCCPGWIKFAEHNFPDFLDNISTCKSPQQMFGALAKTYYAQQAGIDPAKVVVVSIMPCTAKKFECERPEMTDSGYKDVDYVMTTRELAQMMREAGLEDIASLPESEYDDPLGKSTGAAIIFGATGGVMEAALRTAYEVVTGKTLPSLDFEMVRGLEGIKEATIQVGDIPLKVAVAHTLGNARRLLEAVRAGKADYHFIEIMACPGGCIGGGGQPVPICDETRLARIRATYNGDADMPLRKSHENPSVAELYAKFLEKPLGHKSHHLLHTHYTPRNGKAQCPAAEPKKAAPAVGATKV